MLAAYPSPPANAFGSTSSYPFTGPAPVVSAREQYLRDLEDELREDTTSSFSPAYNNAKRSATVDLGLWSFEHVQPARIDGRGRQTNFKETVRQRQERLEFLRRQEFSRRLALKGLSAPVASSSFQTRLPSPRKTTPAQRVLAATKIQRVFRSHLARRQTLADIESIASTFDELRASHISTVSRATARASKRSMLRHDLSVCEYEDRLRLYKLELQAVLIGADHTARTSGRALMSRMTEELSQLKQKKVSLRVQESRASHHSVLTIIEEEDDSSVEDLHPIAVKVASRSYRRPTMSPPRYRRILARTPSLESIRESDAELGD